MIHGRRCVLVMVATTLLGCPGSSGDGGGGGSVAEEDWPQALAHQVCGLIHEECDCPDPAQPDAASCEDFLLDGFDEQAQEAKAGGLIYDASCGKKAIDQWKLIGCAPDPAAAECVGCSPYHGTVAMGQPCTMHGIYSDCAQGLFCYEVCIDACDGFGLSEGEACRGPAGETLGVCDYGLTCNDTDTCVATPDVGEPCPDLVCAPGATCDVMVDPAVCVESGPFVCLLG